MLHDALVDLLTKHVATCTLQLHQRTLERPGSQLTIVLIPLLYGSSMDVDVSKVVDALIHSGYSLYQKRHMTQSTNNANLSYR